MLCPNCGVVVPDNRQTCPNCGSFVNPQPSMESDYQYDLTPPSNDLKQPKQGVSRKKIITLICVIIIIIVAIIGIAFWNQVKLKITFIDTERDILIIKVKNEGWGTAKEDLIEVKLNYKEKLDWKDGDIPSGETKEGRINPSSTYFITDVQIYYNGVEQDHKG